MTEPSPTQPEVWQAPLLRNPHAVADKRGRVQRMFAAIAPSYDLNNRVHSLGLDQRWRKAAVLSANLTGGETVVDVACGTGDLALKFAIGGAGRVVGVDFTFPMLPLAAAKQGRAQACDRLAASLRCRWLCGDAMGLPLADRSADVLSIAFGIRNVADPAAALREFYRVLRPGGRLVILEFSLPTRPILRGLYNFYFRRILPRTATLLSGDRTGAYRYLPESVNTFMDRQRMLNLIGAAGFETPAARALTFGICICYTGRKPA